MNNARIPAALLLSAALSGCALPPPGSAVTESCHPIVEHAPFGPWAQPTLNLGCATRQNLAAMVAEPNDLQHGATLPPPDAAFLSSAIDRYRKSQTVPLQKEQSKGQEK